MRLSQSKIQFNIANMQKRGAQQSVPKPSELPDNSDAKQMNGFGTKSSE